MIEELIEDLRGHEGYRETPYYDSLGILTIGWGHNLLVSPFSVDQMKRYFKCGYPIDRRAFLDEVFRKDVTTVIEDVNRVLPWVSGMTDNVRRGLYNMAFQMGVSGLLSFKRSLPLIRSEKWKEAAQELFRSRWAEQTPKRAREVIYTITGINI